MASTNFTSALVASSSTTTHASHIKVAAVMLLLLILQTILPLIPLNRDGSEGFNFSSTILCLLYLRICLGVVTVLLNPAKVEKPISKAKFMSAMVFATAFQAVWCLLRQKNNTDSSMVDMGRDASGDEIVTRAFVGIGGGTCSLYAALTLGLAADRSKPETKLVDESDTEMWAGPLWFIVKFLWNFAKNHRRAIDPQTSPFTYTRAEAAGNTRKAVGENEWGKELEVRLIGPVPALAFTSGHNTARPQVNSAQHSSLLQVLFPREDPSSPLSELRLKLRSNNAVGRKIQCTRPSLTRFPTIRTSSRRVAESTVQLSATTTRQPRTMGCGDSKAGQLSPSYDYSDGAKSTGFRPLDLSLERLGFARYLPRFVPAL
ncbi:hypothetical protein B0H12DRAFT_1081073 [Mycena haematopus]|nr:hypothetical protein B0H12DRAFT_1081073 [Mycena haematopus]